MKELSIVIVNYNVRYFLELCLKSVEAAITKIDAEIIVVDNNSPDDSCAMVQSLFPNVVLIANTKNTGFATANNQGVAQARGKYLCVLNPDTVVGENTFLDMLAFAQLHPESGAIGARLIDGTGAFLPECKRNLPTPKVAFQKIFGNGDLYYSRALKKTENGPVEILVGAFMFLKTSVYREVGGFDEQYFMYGEDIDLSYTISKAGYQNYYVGTSPVIHFKGESTSKDAVYRKRFFGAMRIFYEKHMKRNALESLMVRVGLLLASLSRKRTVQEETRKPKSFAALGADESLVMRLTEVLKEEVKTVDGLESLTGDEEIFLEANAMGYDRIIETISKHHNRGFTFKIIPKNSTFALGSNSSDGQGSLLKF